MDALLNILRSRDWITAQRMRLWPAPVLAASGAGFFI